MYKPLEMHLKGGIYSNTYRVIELLKKEAFTAAQIVH
jgi:hypothetical protein